MGSFPPFQAAKGQKAIRNILEVEGFRVEMMKYRNRSRDSRKPKYENEVRRKPPISVQYLSNSQLCLVGKGCVSKCEMGIGISESSEH